MKILMVNKFLYPNGGSETYIFKIGEYLQKQGHTVEYFGMEHKDRIVGNSADSYTSNMDFHTGKLAKLLYPFKILYSFEARKKIRCVLEQLKPDVVHLNNINFQLTPSVIDEIRAFEKKCGKKIRIVATAHDYQWVCPNHMLMIPESGELCTRCLGGHFENCAKKRCIHGSAVKSLLGTIEGYLYRIKGTYKKIDCVICPSAFLAEKLRENPALHGRLTVLHNFVEEYIGKSQGDEQASCDKTAASVLLPNGVMPGQYVLYFGRFSKEKGIETLLCACRNLPEIPFVFAGSGPLQNRVNLAAKAENSNVKNVGFQSGEALYQLIANAQFTVYPSEWYENCPFSVMESQMYQTPVLGADIGGIPELIEEGRTGEIYESGNVDALTDAIYRLWTDEKRCNIYRENCKALPFDTLDEYCKKLMAIYTGAHEKSNRAV